MILMSIKIMSDIYHIICQLHQQFQKTMTKQDILSGFKPTPFQRYILFKSGSISPQKSRKCNSTTKRRLRCAAAVGARTSASKTQPFVGAAITGGAAGSV